MLSGYSNQHFAAHFPRTAADIFDDLQNVQSISHVTKDDLSPVQLRLRRERDVELTAVGVGTVIDHGNATATVMRNREIFVSKWLSVYGMTAGSIAVGKVAAMTERAGDRSVKGRVFKTVFFLTGAESAKILAGLRADIDG